MTKQKNRSLIKAMKKFEASGDEFDQRIFRHFIDGANSAEVSPDEEQITFRTFYAINRYFFDFNVDFDHWMQVDSSQDAPYYGTWCSPKLLTRISYVEGDISVVLARDYDAFLTMMHETVDWNKHNDTWVGFDPGLNPGSESFRFIEDMKNGKNRNN